MRKQPNAQQQQVVDELANNIILYASAGTGKTFTVANRVANIIAQKKTTPDKILCLTFTIKACNELKEDVEGYVGEVGKQVQISTIHGFCYKVILEESKRVGNGYCAPSICDEVDQEEILKSILSSRLSFWKMQRFFNERWIPTPDLTACPLAYLENRALVWLYDDYAIFKNGNVLALQGEKVLPPMVCCPICGEEFNANEGVCKACGNEFVYSLADNHFEIFNRRAALRNLVSEIKHYRESLKLYGEGTEKDYLDTFLALKEDKPRVYDSLISYYAKYVGAIADAEFEECMQDFLGRLICEYDEHLRLSNLLDFDDLILKANTIFDSPEGQEHWSKAYSYIIVDEMQDTSTLEYAVLKKIFAKNNVMFCGDFFQTIYGWRGSRPMDILESFTKEFTAKAFMLSENYRATKTLAAATFGYLKNTYPELLGKYCPVELQINSQVEGERIYCYAYDNREQEAWRIYKYLLNNRPQNPLDICIIARTNKYIAELVRYFEYFNAEREEGIHFFTVEENFQFFKKPLVKDILAVLKLLLNPFDRVSMERLTEKFVRQVGVKTIESLRQYSSIGICITSFLEKQAYEFGDVYYRLIEGLQTNTLVVYDTETTGLDLEKDEIVQISAIKINANGDVLDTLDIFVEPSIDISADAYKTHGFDLEYLRANGAVTPKEALEEFSSFVKSCTLVGHNNLAYDKPLVQRQLRENALPPLAILAEYDTLVLAKQFYPQLEDYKLSTLCARFEVVNSCAHNALGDIEATGKCLAKIIKDSVLPTTTERRTVLEKYRGKFEKIFVFMQEMRRQLDEGEELGEFIIESLRLSARYKTRSDYAAMQDVIQSLKSDCTDKRAFLREYLKDAALSGSQMDILIKKLNKIPVITVHQAKGCEFDTVFLVGADDRNFPSYAATQSGDEEEEKKVFYVAITRAKRKLIMTRALYNGHHECRETPYFWAIPEEYVRQNRAWKNGV